MEINKDFPKGRSLFLFIMGLIKINNIIYGSNSASDIIYKNTTVEEKLNAIPVFDPSDNINIEDAKYDYLTYGHIIDNLNSSATDKVLSANQGKILNENIDILSSFLEEKININIDNINNNTIDIVDLNTQIISNKNNVDNEINILNSLLTNINNELLKINRICIGSQVLYPSLSGSGTKAKTAFIGAYGNSLINGIFNGITIPSGWHKEFRITYQAHTSKDGQISIYLNNIKAGGVQTWSGDTFRIIGGSNFFKDSDVIQEPTYGYSSSGMNLYYESTTSSNWAVWNITLHGYLVKDS